MPTQAQKDAARKIATYIDVIQRYIEDTPGLTVVDLAREMQWGDTHVTRETLDMLAQGLRAGAWHDTGTLLRPADTK